MSLSATNLRLASTFHLKAEFPVTVPACNKAVQVPRLAQQSPLAQSVRGPQPVTPPVSR